MSDLAVCIENLSKLYHIDGQRERYKTLRTAITDLLFAPYYRIRSISQRSKNVEYDDRLVTIWALKNISCEIRSGEVLGIIGNNGAGKSTLLKILSRITEPTMGWADIYGRVGSLLEVGTGFHPELTGRENIYLNGAILGMRQFEIERKFDEIVSFAEIEKFIDTPVKRYSSGMYMRLAFAVAAHLEPEIMLVDEVLAVGDAAFQKKCLGKMGQVAQEGRTVLFVSHNLAAVQSLCSRVIWLQDGQIAEDGLPEQIIPKYLQTASSKLTEQVWEDIITAPGNDTVRLHRVRIRPVGGSHYDEITMSTPSVIEIEFWNLIPDIYLDVTLHIQTEHGITAFGTSTIHEPEWHGLAFLTGLYRSTCYIPGNLLNSGAHQIILLIVKNQGVVTYRHEKLLSFEVLDSLEARGSWYGKLAGVVRPKLEWKTEYIDSTVLDI